MSRAQRRAQESEDAKVRRAFVATLPQRLVSVPKDEWPPYPLGPSAPPTEIWRSRWFLVQVYAAPNGQERFSVQRTNLLDGITWDELQAIKTEIGRGHKTAVEVYPPTDRVVNVANMRHLWTLPEMPDWAWKAT